MSSLADVAEAAPYSGCGYTVSGRAFDMGQRNYFSHTIPDCGNRKVFDMMRDAGITYDKGGENIGWLSGTQDPTTAADILHDKFMNSPGHRANVLDGDYNAVGVGSWFGGSTSWTGAGEPRTKVVVTAVVFAKLPNVSPPPSVTPPGAPAWVSATAGNGRLDASWSAVPGPVDAYALLAFDSNGFTGKYTIACATCTSGSVSGLSNGTAYLIGVVAGNGAGWGPASYSGWVTAGTPSAPRNVGISAGSGRVEVTWSAPATSNGDPIDGYAALAYTSSGFTGSYELVCATCTRATLTNLSPGTTVQAVVLAYNGNGWGALGVSGWTTVRS